MVEEVRIESLGAQGDGVTADDVFIPGTLPGERVRADISGHRGRLLGVLAPAADRISPVCPHFGSCGGCRLQHASDGLLAGWKRDLVHRALSARGIEDVEILPTETSPAASRRRATLTGRRTRKGAVVGFHAQGSEEIVAVETCPVAVPEITAILPALRRIVAEGASRKGELRLTVTASEAGLDVAVTGGKPVEGGLYGELVAVAATANLARLSWNGESVVTRRPPVQMMGQARVEPPPGGFLQATVHAEAVLVVAMRRATDGARRIADLFAGSGTFALPLAENAEVHAVESEAEALAALDTAWRATPGLKKVGTETRDLFHRPLLTREFDPFDAVVFDPPRQGARAQVAELARSGIARIGAVSCNPATFARDARILIVGGFMLDWVQPVDQFRWSPHIELAAAFERK